jgi:yeast amino acid transporter
MVMQALGEMAVLYPQNGAFTTYIIRFIDVGPDPRVTAM